MAYVKSNDLVDGFSGAFGIMVFKRYKDKTVVCRRAKKPQKESESQRKNRDRFRQATMYAQQMMDIPERKAYYKRKAKKMNLTNAYTAAITDFMRKPTITEVSTKGDVVRVFASKRNFPIRSVKVMGFNKNGEQTIEAQAVDKDGYWMFKIPEGADIQQIVAVAEDYTENVAQGSIQLA